jgi:hypothetical protein
MSYGTCHSIGLPLPNSANSTLTMRAFGGTWTATEPAIPRVSTLLKLADAIGVQPSTLIDDT